MKIKDFHQVELFDGHLELTVRGEKESYTWLVINKNLVLEWLENEIDSEEYYQELPWFLIER